MLEKVAHISQVMLLRRVDLGLGLDTFSRGPPIKKVVTIKLPKPIILKTCLQLYDIYSIKENIQP